MSCVILLDLPEYEKYAYAVSHDLVFNGEDVYLYSWRREKDTDMWEYSKYNVDASNS